MTNSLVTIVIPVYNRAHTLPRLFASLKTQTYRPIEVILVDNCSADNSYDVCRSIANENQESDFKIRLLSESTPGAAAARNRGLRQAKGDIVSFFDSDDEMSADFIASLMTEWQQRPDADFVVARSRMILKNGKAIERGGLDTLSLHAQILSGALSTQSFIAKTAFIKRIGGWNPQLLFWDDYELGIRMLQHSSKFIKVNRTFHRIYQHDDSLTGPSLSATLPSIQTALPRIIQQILTPKTGVVTVNSRTALFYRLCILAGKLKAERNSPGTQWLETYAQQVAKDCKLPALTRTLGWALQTYTANGGRGAWRIAIMLLK
jgi:GT2 family glycosyltransferase